MINISYCQITNWRLKLTGIINNNGKICTTLLSKKYSAKAGTTSRLGKEKISNVLLEKVNRFRGSLFDVSVDVGDSDVTPRRPAVRHVRKLEDFQLAA